MKIKISGNGIAGVDTDSLNANLTDILNVASVVAMTGYIPTDYDKMNANKFGKYWFLEPEYNRYQLSGHNNAWANIRDEGGNFSVLEFSFRYDPTSQKEMALNNLILAFFPHCSTVVE